MAKEGSTLSGIMDAFALSVSISLQYGVPLRALVDKFVELALRALGLHRQSRDSLREIHRGLHRALARREIHLTRLSRSRSRCGRVRGHRHTCRRHSRKTERVSYRHEGSSGFRSFHSCARRNRRRAVLLRVRHAHDSQRKLLQVLELRQHLRLQLTESSRSAIGRSGRGSGPALLVSGWISRRRGGDGQPGRIQTCGSSPA